MSTLLRSSIVIATMALCAAGIGACSKSQAPAPAISSAMSEALSGMDREKVESVRADIIGQASRLKVPLSAVTYFDIDNQPISEAAFYEGLIANPKNAWKMVGKSGVTTSADSPDTKTASVSVHLMNAP
jgi:hypothetical protein